MDLVSRKTYVYTELPNLVSSFKEFRVTWILPVDPWVPMSWIFLVYKLWVKSQNVNSVEVPRRPLDLTAAVYSGGRGPWGCDGTACTDWLHQKLPWLAVGSVARHGRSLPCLQGLAAVLHVIDARAFIRCLVSEWTSMRMRTRDTVSRVPWNNREKWTFRLDTSCVLNFPACTMVAVAAAGNFLVLKVFIVIFRLLFFCCFVKLFLHSPVLISLDNVL